MNSLFRSRTGLTLTELLVASVLVGIVMLGAISVDFAIRNTKLGSSRVEVLSKEVGATILNITRDAMLTAGDNSMDLLNANSWQATGIYTYDVGDNFKSICFRQDINSTPENYADDPWACYSHGNDLDIYRCSVAANPAFAGWQNCNNPSGRKLVHVTQTDFFDVVPDADNHIQSIDISLTARSDPNSAVNPVMNPQYSLESSISPPGLSR